jgi:hypothetical protein
VTVSAPPSADSATRSTSSVSITMSPRSRVNRGRGAGDRGFYELAIEIPPTLRLASGIHRTRSSRLSWPVLG